MIWWSITAAIVAAFCFISSGWEAGQDRPYQFCVFGLVGIVLAVLAYILGAAA